MQVKFNSAFDFLQSAEIRKAELCKQIQSMLNDTPTLKALGEKIEHMVLNIGSPVSVYPMLNRIIFKGVKHLSQGIPGYDPEPLGKGHFRWDWKAYTLTEQELKIVVKLFKWLR